MAWIATGTRMSAAELLSKVAGELPDGHETTVRTESWGSWAVADVVRRPESPAAWRHDGQWLVAGHPTRSPWGVPPNSGLGEVITDLVRFGGVATSMYAGPVVAVSTADGSWHCALNGLMAPGPMINDHRVMLTSAPARLVPSAGDPIDDDSPAFTYERLAGEITDHMPPHLRRCTLDDPVRGPLFIGGSDWSNEVFWIDHHAQSLVLTPSNLAEVLADPTLLDLARSTVVPNLAWRAERRGLVLYAPFLERVVLDQVGYGAGRGLDQQHAEAARS